MKSYDYLKEAISNKVYRKKAWLLSAFAVTMEDKDEWTKDPYNYRIVRQMNNIFFVKDRTLVQLDDIIPNEPLFLFDEEIELDPSWIVNLDKVVTTSIGNLLINQIAIVEPFGKKIPFIVGKVDIGYIEDIIASRLANKPDDNQVRSDDYIYTDEYHNFVDAVSYLEGISHIVSVAATSGVVRTPLGFKEFKEQKLKEYGDTIKDPVTLAKFKDELKAYAANSLKDDPAFGTFLSGKRWNIAYQQSKLLFGETNGFDENKTQPVISKSLEEGWSTKTEDIVNMFNGARIGSYARGTDTQLGGTTSKTLLRASNMFTITSDDCGTTEGLKKRIFKHNLHRLDGAYIRENNTWVYVDDKQSSSKYIGKTVTIRSPQYCKASGFNVCKFCVDKQLGSNPNGIPIAATGISDVILTMFLKKIHGGVLATQVMDLDIALS